MACVSDIQSTAPECNYNNGTVVSTPQQPHIITTNIRIQYKYCKDVAFDPLLYHHVFTLDYSKLTLALLAYITD